MSTRNPGDVNPAMMGPGLALKMPGRLAGQALGTRTEPRDLVVLESAIV